MIDVVAAVGCGAVAGVGCLAVPRLIAALPEPAEPPTREEGDPVKVAYAEIAAAPLLATRAALVGALVGGVLGARLGWSWPLLPLLAVVPVLVALAVVDWRTHLLPVRLVWPATLLAAVLVAAAALLDPAAGVDALVRAALGFVVAYGTFYLLWLVHPRGLGFGDVRLAGLLGLLLGLLGWGELLVGLYAGFLLGGVVGGLLTLVKVLGRRAFPFGPFMVAGALVGVVWGEPLLRGLVRG